MVARWGEAPPPVLQGDRVLAAGWDGPPPTPAAMPPGTRDLPPGTRDLPPSLRYPACQPPNRCAQ